MPAILKVKRLPALPEKFLRVGQKRVEAPHVVKADAHKELIGQAVFFASEGERMAGKAVRVNGDSLVIQLAVPNREGVLIVTDTELTVKATDLEVTKALMQAKRVRHFEFGADLKLGEGDRKAVAITAPLPGGDGKQTYVVDYRDVVIDGFASTFQSTTPSDRGGDYVLPGAFDKTLLDFKKNPVMLLDHCNEVECIAGSWDKVGTNTRGLAVTGNVSNAPGLCDVRHKLVEGHLKGLSIGGIWYYLQDGRGIEEAELFEISLVAVPMNPDTLCQTRSLGIADCRKAFAKFWRTQTSLRTG